MSTEHFPAPGETVSCGGLFFELGGKGYNQAVACDRMGVDTVFFGAVGKDDNGNACQRELAAEGITPCLIEKEIPTAYAVITTDATGENTVCVFPGAAKALTPEDLRTDRVMSQLRTCTCLLLQNELSTDCLLEACKIGRELDIPVIFNPAPAKDIPPEVMEYCSLITPNYGEAKQLTGYLPHEQPTAKQLIERFANQGIENVIITMGSAGAVIADHGKICKIPPFSCGKALDTTGAGDTFNGVLTAMLAKENTPEQAAKVAAVAAGISVTRKGAAGSIPTGAEVNVYRKVNAD